MPPAAQVGVPRRQHQQLHAGRRSACRPPTAASTAPSREWRGKSRQRAGARSDDFWGGRKEAEEQ